ncbi:unnamed protein product [Closterium sp. Naga37s-1]|nr:unnamed protein product [Closterium sp. Naga37s-1]
MSAARQRLSAAIQSNRRLIRAFARPNDQISRSIAPLPTATATIPAPSHTPQASPASQSTHTWQASRASHACCSSTHAHIHSSSAAAAAAGGGRMRQAMQARVSECEVRAPLRAGGHSMEQLRCFTTPAALASAWGSAPRAAAASEAPSAPASHSTPDDAEESIEVTFVQRDGSEAVVQVSVGTNMLQAAHDNDIDLEGACEASLACSTCHVIVMDEEQYSKMPEPTDEENDMLDLAFGLTETSRLGCQVIATKDLNGLRLKLPSATRNFAVDGFVPKPH